MSNKVIVGTDDNLEELISEGYTFVDFYADWCAACHELDEKTWPDPEVQNLLGRIIAVKLDLTKYDSRTKAIQKKYRFYSYGDAMFIH